MQEIKAQQEVAIMDEAAQGIMEKTGSIYCAMKLMSHAYATLLATGYQAAHTMN